MWHNHVATFANANNSGRHLDLNKIGFSCFHYIVQNNFWLEFISEKLNNFTGIWKRLKVTLSGPQA